MQSPDAFFNTLKQHYNNKLPFVVYSRPIYTTIKCWLQNNDTLYKTESFTESGFVFAPFNLDKPTILFPQDQSEFHEMTSGFDFESNMINETTAEDNNRERKEQHIKLVSKGIDAINDGELKKVVLSRVEQNSVLPLDPIDVFKCLYKTYKNAMVYCWYHPKVGLWLGATPELLFKVEGQQLTTISLAGTQNVVADKTPEWTAKELEEQQIVTDFLADQIQPYTTTTKISEVETIRAGNLWHLKTRLISRITSKSNLRSIIDALHPTPAVCGFPKDKAKAFILKHEAYNREYYTGFLGELNLKQTTSRNTNRRNVENNAYATVKTQSNFYVNLRCMQLKNNSVNIYVGGGLTKDSVAENEWIETCNKTKTIRAVLN